jgi:hypothetical protein
MDALELVIRWIAEITLSITPRIWNRERGRGLGEDNKVDSGRYGGSSERGLDIYEGWIASVLLDYGQMSGCRTVDDV